MDNMTKQQRSRTMAKIRSTESKPEIVLRRCLFKLGFRYRKNVGGLPGKPDLVLTKYKTVIFVNGCFWHQHPSCQRATIPKSNTNYWTHKLYSNVLRDSQNLKTLESLGWKVLILWECEIKNDLPFVITKAASFIKSTKDPK